MSIQDPPQDGPTPATSHPDTPHPDAHHSAVLGPDLLGRAPMTDTALTQEPAGFPDEPVLPEVAASLTQALRTMYDNVVDEPLPDAFAQLLSRLDDGDA